MSVLNERVQRYIRTSTEQALAESPKRARLSDQELRDIYRISALEWAIRDLMLAFERPNPRMALEALLTYWDVQSEAWEQEQDRTRYEADECAAALQDERLEETA